MIANSPKQNLAGKTALITGGSRGIGRAIAQAYAERGAQVFICGRNAADIALAVSEIANSGARVAGAAGDIGALDDVKRITADCVARFGEVDVLVNNASILGPREAIVDYPIAAWHEVIRINLTGLFLLTHEVLPVMLRRNAGSIINLTSGVGRVGKAKWGAYAVSKAALEGFTQVLADELRGAGIRVNSVNPAATRTQMRAEAYPAEDPLTLPTAESITPIFVYLASDDSLAVTGQALNAREWARR